MLCLRLWLLYQLLLRCVELFCSPLECNSIDDLLLLSVVVVVVVAAVVVLDIVADVVVVVESKPRRTH